MMQATEKYQQALASGTEFIDNIIAKKYFMRDPKTNKPVESKYEHAVQRWTGEIKAQGVNGEYLEGITNMLMEGRYIPGGGISFGLGNHDVKCSLSNCYFTPIEEDSIDGIFDCLKQLAKTYSRRGGSGADITILRPKNAPVHNAARFSSGAVSFMPMFSEVTNTIGQNGRRGAMIILLDIRHPDIMDFIWSKSRAEQIFGRDALTGRVPDVSGANITIKLTDEFMMAVVNDDDWDFIFPDTDCDEYRKEWKGDYDDWAAKGLPVIKHNTIKARKVLMEIAESAWISGDPGVQYWDTITKWSSGSFDKRLTPAGCNPCLPGWAPVLTPEGYKSFKNVKNKIFINGESHECSDLIHTGSNRNIWEVELQNGMSLYATSNHQITTDQGDIELQNLTMSNKIKMDYSPIPYEPIDILGKPYNDGFIAGWLFGDGSIWQHRIGKYSLSFILGLEEFEFEEELLEILTENVPGFDYDFKPHPQKPDTCKTVMFKRQSTVNYILDDIFDCKSKDEFNLIDKPLEYQMGFIESFFTCDGHTTLGTDNCVGINQSGDRGYRILKQCQLVLASLGIYSNLTLCSKAKVDSRGINCKNSYRLEIRDVEEFDKHFTIRFNSVKADRIEKICYMDNEERNKRLANKKQWQTIKEIKKLDWQDEVYDIQVPGVNHFVSSGQTVHNCGEQQLAKHNNCLLAAQVLHKYVKNPYTPHAEFDNALFLDDVSNGVVFMDTLCSINMEKHPLKEQRDADKYGRRIGQEFTGLGDMWAMLGLEYGSDEALTFLDDLLFFKAREEIKTSLRLAKERGCAPCLKSKTSRRRFLDQPYIQRLLDRMLPANAKALEEEIMQHGLRNSAFNTVGPAGTISIMADNCTSGIEPLFDVEYYRETRVEGSEKERIFHYPLLKHVGPELFNMTKEDILKKYHYREAHEIDYRTRLNVQSTVQHWTDSSVSSTVNLAENCTVNDIFNIYLEGHALGIKGLTVFRDGSKKGVLTKDGYVEGTDDMSIDIEGYLEHMKTKLSRTQRAYRCIENWKGVKVYINVVVDDKEKPIEVFTNIPWEAGVDDKGDFQHHVYNERKSYWDAICRLTSLNLRTSMDIKHVVKQLQRSTTSMVDLPAILLRTLNRFMDTDAKTCEKIKKREEQGEMCPKCQEPGIVHRGGCVVCLLCAYSECG